MLAPRALLQASLQGLGAPCSSALVSKAGLFTVLNVASDQGCEQQPVASTSGRGYATDLSAKQRAAVQLQRFNATAPGLVGKTILARVVKSSAGKAAKSQEETLLVDPGYYGLCLVNRKELGTLQTYDQHGRPIASDDAEVGRRRRMRPGVHVKLRIGSLFTPWGDMQLDAVRISPQVGWGGVQVAGLGPLGRAATQAGASARRSGAAAGWVGGGGGAGVGGGCAHWGAMQRASVHEGLPAKLAAWLATCVVRRLPWAGGAGLAWRCKCVTHGLTFWAGLPAARTW